MDARKRLPTKKDVTLARARFLAEQSRPKQRLANGVRIGAILRRHAVCQVIKRGVVLIADLALVEEATKDAAGVAPPRTRIVLDRKARRAFLNLRPAESTVDEQVPDLVREGRLLKGPPLFEQGRNELKRVRPGRLGERQEAISGRVAQCCQIERRSVGDDGCASEVTGRGRWMHLGERNLGQFMVEARQRQGDEPLPVKERDVSWVRTCGDRCPQTALEDDDRTARGELRGIGDRDRNQPDGHIVRRANLPKPSHICARVCIACRQVERLGDRLIQIAALPLGQGPRNLGEGGCEIRNCQLVRHPVNASRSLKFRAHSPMNLKADKLEAPSQLKGYHRMLRVVAGSSDETIAVHSPVLGRLELDAGQILYFAEPIAGFESCVRYVLLPYSLAGREDPTMSWLQAVDAPFHTFLVTDPWSAIVDYHPEIADAEVRAVQATEFGETTILGILTVARSTRELTINLQAPLLVNMKCGVAKQVLILNSEAYSSRARVCSLP